jgi:hypothetical protein
MSAKPLLVFLALARLAAGATAARADADPLSATGLTQDVVSRAESPHVYDWRRADAELQAGYGYIDEANNFESDVFELGVGIPAGDGSLLRFGLRRAYVHGTPSSNDIGRTPFRQKALPTRYEAYGGYAFGLLEGRSMTRFSPTLPDFEHAMFFWAGAHYSHPNAGLVPKRSEPPKPLPGQDPVNAKIVLELGLRWQIYTPQSFGVFFEAMTCRPLGERGAPPWQYLASGVLWSFGAH